MGHVPSSFISDRKMALKVLGGNSLLGRANQVDRQEPLGKRQMGIVKDSPGSHRKVILAIYALIKMAHFASFASSFVSEHAGFPAANTDKTLGPANTLKVLNALFLSIEPFDNVEKGRWFVHG
jgi:hypothetical protein